MKTAALFLLGTSFCGVIARADPVIRSARQKPDRADDIRGKIWITRAGERKLQSGPTGGNLAGQEGRVAAADVAPF